MRKFITTSLFLLSILMAWSVKAQDYQCNGDNILSGVSFQLGTPYFTDAYDDWVASTNYTAVWDNGELTLHLGNSTVEAWQAQFPITCASQTLTTGKTYFLSFDIQTNVDLPRVYMKLQAAADNNTFVDLPSQSVTAGTHTISGIAVNTAGAIDEIGFDFGGNPANADIVISNITLCADYTGETPPIPTYVCNSANILSGVDFTPGVIWYSANGSSASTNYTEAWDNGALNLHLGDATYSQWNAQFNLTCPSQTLTAGKTYFLSFEIKTNVALPRVYMKLQAAADNNHFVDLPSLSVPAGADTIVSGITANTAGAFDMILFDFGTNPSNADITISNITLCDDYTTAGEEPTGPTEPATPTRDPSNVLSVYCNAYTNIAGINYNPNWGQPTQVNPTFAVGSSTLLQYTNFTYQGTEFPDQNVTDMTYLHIELWSPAAFTTNIYPISHDPADDTKSYPLALQANQWNVFDIPLTAFAIPQYSIWQFKFDSGTGNTFYIANWYFYNENTTPDTEAPTNFTATQGTVTKNSVELLLNADDNSGAVFYTIKYGTPVQTVTVGGQSGVQRSYTVSGLTDNTAYTFTVTVTDRAKNTNANTLTVDATTPPDPLTQPTTAAPTPTAAAENVISVFSDAYTTASWYNMEDWGQTTTHSTIKIAGVNTLKLETFNYQGFTFAGAGGNLDVSGMDYLHIDVWTPNLTSFKITIGGATVTCTPVNIDQWNSYDIPIADLAGGDLTSVAIMEVYGTAAVPAESTAYLENIYFYKAPPAPVQVTLKVIDQSKGLITNDPANNPETNIFCWIDDNLKAQNPRTPDNWWYPMYDSSIDPVDSNIIPNGTLVQGANDWTWEITFSALPGTYDWNPEAKSLGWKTLNNGMYDYTGDDGFDNFIFTVSDAGVITGTTELVIPDYTGISKIGLNNAVVVGGKSSISATFKGAANVSVYSVQGVLIKTASAQGDFEIGNLEAGIYLVKVNNSVYKAVVK